jgi:hypothetical protein
LVFGIALAIALGGVFRILTGTAPRFRREDLRRLERLSERRQREDSLPFG